MMVWRRLFWPLGALAAAGCASSSSAVHVEQHVDVGVMVVASPSGASSSSGPIDPHDPRTAAASAAIAALIGHALTFQIDAGLAARPGIRLQESLVSAMEATVDGLRYSRERKADAVAYVSPLLKTILLAYWPSAEAPAPSFDPASGVLTFHVPPKSDELLEPGDLQEAITDAFDAATTARFADREPESVPPAEQRAYYQYLAGSHGRVPGGEKERTADHLLRLTRLLRLYDPIADAALRVELRHRLAQFASNLWQLHDSANPAAWASAHDLYVRWANARAAEFEPTDRRAIAEAFFNEFRDPQLVLLQGFDVVRFATPALQAFAAADGDDRQQGDMRAVIDRVVCPANREGNRVSLGGCNGALYSLVSAQSGAAARFASIAASLKNAHVTETLALNLLFHVSTPAALGFVDALDDASAADAVRGLADFPGWNPRYYQGGSRPGLPLDPNGYVAWVRAAWKSRPALRGALLYALTQLDDAREDSVPWGRLPAFLGSAIGAQELDSFLDQSPRTFWNLETISKGLSLGWSRSRVLLPRFERWLADFAAHDDGSGSRAAISEHIVSVLCQGHDPSEVAALQSFVRSRVESFPHEKNQYGSIATSSVASLCGGVAMNARPVAAPVEHDRPFPPPERPKAPATHAPSNPAAVPVLFDD